MQARGSGCPIMDNAQRQEGRNGNVRPNPSARN
jgi:hypothetical protein